MIQILKETLKSLLHCDDEANMRKLAHMAYDSGYKDAARHLLMCLDVLEDKLGSSSLEDYKDPTQVVHMVRDLVLEVMDE